MGKNTKKQEKETKVAEVPQKEVKKQEKKEQEKKQEPKKAEKGGKKQEQPKAEKVESKPQTKSPSAKETGKRKREEESAKEETVAQKSPAKKVKVENGKAEKEEKKKEEKGGHKEEKKAGKKEAEEEQKKDKKEKKESAKKPEKQEAEEQSQADNGNEEESGSTSRAADIDAEAAKKAQREKLAQQRAERRKSWHRNESWKEETKHDEKPLTDKDKEKDERTVFVGNVSLKTTKKSLETLFKQYGKVESVRFRSVPIEDSKLPRRAAVLQNKVREDADSQNAYVVMSSVEQAKEALKAHNTLLDGHHIRLDLASNDKHDNKNTVFVGSLPFTASEEAIRTFFEQCGQVEYVRAVRDPHTNMGKGIAFVRMQDAEGCKKAMRMDGKKFENRVIRVSRSVDPRRRAKKELQRAKARGVVPASVAGRSKTGKALVRGEAETSVTPETSATAKNKEAAQKRIAMKQGAEGVLKKEKKSKVEEKKEKLSKVSDKSKAIKKNPTKSVVDSVKKGGKKESSKKSKDQGDEDTEEIKSLRNELSAMIAESKGKGKK